MTIPALCNSCARVRYFDTPEAANLADCQCGGTSAAGDAFCACADCHDKAIQLMNGQRDARALRMVGDFSAWSAEKGLPDVF